jgi:hypothetical protein
MVLKIGLVSGLTFDASKLGVKRTWITCSVGRGAASFAPGIGCGEVQIWNGLPEL